MKVALHGKNFSPDTLPFVTGLLQHLGRQQACLFASSPLQALLQDTRGLLPALQPLPQDLTPMNCMVSLGGDGTLLEAVKYVGAAEVPVLGINTGRM
ncbi:MAG: NAD(+)/NADH kinase, partial [Bacteroidota bacterium]